MLYRYTLFGCATLLYLNVWGQSPPEPVTRSNSPAQGVSLEIAGNAPILSLNYHLTVLHLHRPSDPVDRGSVEMGLGLGYTPYLLWDQGGNVTFPHHLTINYGNRRVRGEIGYGATNGRQGILFEQAGYQPGLITGLRLVPVPKMAIRLFAWTMFYQQASYQQNAQFQVVRRQTRYATVFPGVSVIHYFNQ